MEIKIECKKCSGTGLYSGMGERDGFAVVCHTCKGTGCDVVQYTPFDGRRETLKVVRVLENNPGICIGSNGGEYALDHFGGMSYKEWAQGLPFPPKSEMRRYTCPAWWYQGVVGKDVQEGLCPDGMWGRSFSACVKFHKKEECWASFDAA